MRIEPTGAGFLIENEKGETLNLSAEEVLILADQSRLLRDQALSKIREALVGGPVATWTQTVREAHTRLDAHHSAMVLRLVLVDGSDDSFLLSRDLVESLAAQTLDKFERLKAAADKRTTQ